MTAEHLGGVSWNVDIVSPEWDGVQWMYERESYSRHIFICYAMSWLPNVIGSNGLRSMRVPTPRTAPRWWWASPKRHANVIAPSTENRVGSHGAWWFPRTVVQNIIRVSKTTAPTEAALRGSARDLAYRSSRLAHARADGTGARHEPTTSEGAYTPSGLDVSEASLAPLDGSVHQSACVRLRARRSRARFNTARGRERAERSGRAMSRHVSAFASTLLSRSASAPVIGKPSCDSS